jgi:XTP/dITP diphosphohydrolase
MKICFATNNPNKLSEIRSIIGDKYQILSLEDINCSEELPETHETIEENALEKSDYIFQKYGIPCFADDSGLIVEALNGAPGVYSARYAGEPSNPEANIEKVLKELRNQENRSAKFKTVIAFMEPNGESKLFKGEISGIITDKKIGEKGFGYDPIFTPNGFDRTFAEMNPEEKNQISHRAIATRKFIEYLSKR